MIETDGFPQARPSRPTPPGWRVGAILGVPVRIWPSALLVSALTIAVWAGSLRGILPFPVGYGTALAFAGVSYAGLLASLLVHEFSHILVARLFGNGCVAVSVTPFGMMAHPEREPLRPIEEAAVVAAGPLTSLALCGLAWLAKDLPGIPGAFAFVMFAINLLLAAFNLVPCFPMDGGRLVRAAAWGWTGDVLRGTVVAARVGWLGAALIAAYGVWIMVSGNPLGIVTTIIAVVMVAQANRQVRSLRTARTLAGTTAGGMMRPFGHAPTTGDLGLTLSGSGDEARIELWRSSGLERIGTLPAGTVGTVRPEATLGEVMEAFMAPNRSGWPVLVVSDGTPLGYVTHGQVMAALG